MAPAPKIPKVGPANIAIDIAEAIVATAKRVANIFLLRLFDCALPNLLEGPLRLPLLEGPLILPLPESSLDSLLDKLSEIENLMEDISTEMEDEDGNCKGCGEKH